MLKRARHDRRGWVMGTRTTRTDVCLLEFSLLGHCLASVSFFLKSSNLPTINTYLGGISRTWTIRMKGAGPI